MLINSHVGAVPGLCMEMVLGVPSTGDGESAAHHNS